MFIYHLSTNFTGTPADRLIAQPSERTGTVRACATAEVYNSIPYTYICTYWYGKSICMVGIRYTYLYAYDTMHGIKHQHLVQHRNRNYNDTVVQMEEEEEQEKEGKNACNATWR